MADLIDTVCFLVQFDSYEGRGGFRPNRMHTKGNGSNVLQQALVRLMTLTPLIAPPPSGEDKRAPAHVVMSSTASDYSCSSLASAALAEYQID